MTNPEIERIALENGIFNDKMPIMHHEMGVSYKSKKINLHLEFGNLNLGIAHCKFSQINLHKHFTMSKKIC